MVANISMVMRPKIGKRVLRSKTLRAKDINAASALESPGKKQLKAHKKHRNSKENIDTDTCQVSSAFSEEADLTTILEQKFHEEGGNSLTSDNVAILQNELVRRELQCCRCDHPLCSDKNRRRVPLRLWFLFELEMMAENGTNFRNLCYHNQIYKDIDPEWKMQDLLRDQPVPTGSEYFAIQQLTIPAIELDRNVDESQIENLQVEVGDVFEGENYKILPTFLSKRNVRAVFDETPMRTSKILSSESPSGSPDLQETIAAQDERKCTLLKKLSLLGGFNPPKLSEK